MVFSFMDYMATLPIAKMDQLYNSEWTCQAVLRSLPPLAKQYAPTAFLPGRSVPSTSSA
jgi:transcription initiation factor TFIIH subunit 4